MLYSSMVMPRTAKMMSRIGVALIALIALIAIGEIATRAIGITDFPTYSVDDGIGYIVKPNQSGRFIDKNSWAFNSKSMPTTEEWNPSARANLLLIGNSVVMGGNPYNQPDKLAPLMAKDIGDAFAVWPAATGGWSNVNEMVYLQRNPDVVKATSFFVWEYMVGGLGGLSVWRGDYVFPSYRPRVASWYTFRRYVLPYFVTEKRNELPPVDDLQERYLTEFQASVAELSRASGRTHPGVIFLYPRKQDLLKARESKEWLPEKAALQKICDQYGLTLVDVSHDPRWTPELYRDGVHPSVAGNVVLAQILSAAVLDAVAPQAGAVNLSPDRVPAQL
jgi:hypothetical protein